MRRNSRERATRRMPRQIAALSPSMPSCGGTRGRSADGARELEKRRDAGAGPIALVVIGRHIRRVESDAPRSGILRMVWLRGEPRDRLLFDLRGIVARLDALDAERDDNAGRDL